MLYSLNELSPRSDPKLCPICGAKIPFSLALHMMAAHSPDAKERLTDTPGSLPCQISAHRQSHLNPRSDSNNTRRRRSGFKQEQGKRRH
jgi:hypothetical protein